MRWRVPLLLVSAGALVLGVAAAADGGRDRSTDGAVLSRDAGIRSASDAMLHAPDAREASSLASDAGAIDAADAGADVAALAIDAAVLDAGTDAAPEASAEPADAGLVLAPLQEKPEAQPPKEAAKTLLRTVIGMLVLLALAYIGGARRVRRLEEVLGLSSAITVGFPFVALGLIARHPAVGVVDGSAIDAVTPLLHFGLGWLGFLLGFRFDLRVLDRLPRGTLKVVAFETTAPFLVIAICCGASLLALGQPLREATFVRDGVVLATAGAMTSMHVLRLLPKQAEAGDDTRFLTSQLDELVGVVGLAVLAAYFRPPELRSAWELPGTAWLFVTIGMGAIFGLLVYAALRIPGTRSEFFLIAIGSVAFTAGMAAYLHLSPIVVCFVAGACVANLPSTQRESFRETLGELERPIYLVFLMLVGALWDPADWRGWLLMGAFVASRFVGLSLGTRLARARAGESDAKPRSVSVFLTPLSMMAIAIVVNAQDLYRGTAVPWIVTAVIGGALVSEIVAQLAARLSLRAQKAKGDG
jgi:Kef-type K+ transport system membrane component KefB